jgi:mannosyltransferase
MKLYKYASLAASKPRLALLSNYLVAVSGTCSRLFLALFVRPFLRRRRCVLMGQKTMLRRYLRPRRPACLSWVPTWLIVVVALAAIEVLFHGRSWAVPRPAENTDKPFYSGCQVPNVDAPRENAVLVMLARNKELEQAKHSIDSIERHFNRWFHYPVLFLNDEPWSDDFVRILNASVSGGATFEVIPDGKWGYPEWMDVGAAKASIAEQGAQGIKYAGKESYHHMCRFFSGSV